MLPQTDPFELCRGPRGRVIPQAATAYCAPGQEPAER